MRYGSLFSGYGGLDMGLQSVLGGSTAWHVEFDKAPSKILAHHWPDVPNYGDITTVDFTKVEPVDVLTGGFPCQDVSHAGRRAGLIRDGEGRTRSGLWGHMLRAVDELRPALVVAENVRGLLSATADSDMEPCPWCVGGTAGGEPPMRALGAVLADLADVGYDAAWYGLRAADVGAAHGRFRVFIFAWPATDTDDGKPHLGAGADGAAHLGTDEGRPVVRSGGRGGEPADLTLLPTPMANEGEKAGQTTRTDGGQQYLTHAVHALLPTPAVNDMGEGKTVEHWDAWTAKMQATHGNGNGHGKSLAIEAQRLLPTPQAHDAADGKTPEQVAAMRARTGAGVWNLNEVAANELSLLNTPSVADALGGHLTRSGARSDEPLLPGQAKAMQGGQWGDYAPAIARWESVIGRSAPAPTEPGPKGGHRLSARFVEFLMGIPAGHVTDVSLTRNEQLKALGNGVVPAQAAAAATAFLTDFAALEATA